MKELSEENILIRMNWNYKGFEAEESVLWSRTSKEASVARI